MKNRVDAGDHLVKTAIIHDWLINRAEEEQSLESLCTLFPDADVYTLFYKPEGMPSVMTAITGRSSGVQKRPGITKYYEYYWP